MGFRVGDDNDDDGNSWTFEELQERIMSERQGRRILQGNTCLQLKEGVGFLHEIHFTHDSKHTKNGSYTLGAIAVDASLIKQVEVAWTETFVVETFVVKDKRCTSYRKHPCPSLSDVVYRLQPIRRKGQRFENLQKAGVNTVKDLLILLDKIRNVLKIFLNSNCTLEDWELDNLSNVVSAILYKNLNNECHATASVSTITRTRWREVFKLLRRNSVRERFNFHRRFNPLKSKSVVDI